MEMNKFTIVREVLRNNYRPHNLIGHLPLLDNKPKKFDFVHQTVSRREARVGWTRD